MAISKLAPDAAMGEALSSYYSGGSSMPDDVAVWPEINGIEEDMIPRARDAWQPLL